MTVSRAQYQAPDLPPVEERPEATGIVEANRLGDNRRLWSDPKDHRAMGQRQLDQAGAEA